MKSRFVQLLVFFIVFCVVYGGILHFWNEQPLSEIWLQVLISGVIAVVINAIVLAVVGKKKAKKSRK